MLKGSELLNTVNTMREAGASVTEQVRACGYEIDGKLHYTDFYYALLEAKGKEPIIAEDDQYQEKIDELHNDYPRDAVVAFIELWGEDYIEHFEDSYQGEMTGAEFAQSLVEDCYCLDMPFWVTIDWEDTWHNLREDYTEQDGFIFCNNF